MPGETTNYKIKYALAADEVEKFPAQVSEPGAETIDETLHTLSQALLNVVTHATSFTVAPGELVKLGASITITLGANGVVGVLPSSLYTAKITAGVAHKIYGGGVATAGVEEVTVLPGQSVLIRVFEGTGFIIAGEVKLEQSVTEALASRIVGTEYEPSLTRPVQVTVQFAVASSSQAEAVLGGTGFAQFQGPSGAAVNPVFTFICPAGRRWKIAQNSGTVSSLYSSYLSL